MAQAPINKAPWMKDAQEKLNLLNQQATYEDSKSAKKTPYHKNYPAVQLLEERLEIVEGVLYWKAAQGKPAAPTTSGNVIHWQQGTFSTVAITWAVAYGEYPMFPVRHKPSSTGDCNVVANLVEVIQSRANHRKPHLEYSLREGFITARVVPSSMGSSRQREVRQKRFTNLNDAVSWAEPILTGLIQTSGLKEVSSPKPKSSGPKRFLALPSLTQSCSALPDLRELRPYLAKSSGLHLFDPYKLDMLSHRACERFVGEALNFWWTFPNPAPSPHQMPFLTVSLGALDGVWRLEVSLAHPGGMESLSRASQEASLAPYAVSATVRLGKTPRNSPAQLRRALLAQYKENPPMEEERMAALSLLTSDRIPSLSQDLRKTQSETLLTPEPDSCVIPMPLFLMNLCHEIDPEDYTLSNGLKRPTGLRVKVTRTRSGFRITLAGHFKYASREELEETPKIVASKLYPSRTSPASYNKIWNKTVYNGVLTNLKGIMRLSPLISEAITNRISQENSTPKQLQTKGIKGTLYVFIDGVKMRLPEALKLYGNVVPYPVARARLKRQWEVKEALTRPVRTPGWPKS